MDSIPVRKENFSEILAVSPGQVPAAKSGQKPTYLVMSLTRKTKPKSKIFSLQTQTCRVEGLNSSRAQ